MVKLKRIPLGSGDNGRQGCHREACVKIDESVIPSQLCGAGTSAFDFPFVQDLAESISRLSKALVYDCGFI